MDPNTVEDTLAEDRLRGIPAIAAFIGEGERRTSYLIERRYITVGREGRHVIASKRQLREDHRRVTGGKAA